MVSFGGGSIDGTSASYGFFNDRFIPIESGIRMLMLERIICGANTQLSFLLTFVYNVCLNEILLLNKRLSIVEVYLL